MWHHGGQNFGFQAFWEPTKFTLQDLLLSRIISLESVILHSLHFFMFSFRHVFIFSSFLSFTCFYYWLLLCCYRECYGSERTFFTLRRFLPYTPLCFCQGFPFVQPWRLQSFPLRFETQTQPICLFESHSVCQLYDKYGTLFKLVQICW